MGRTISSFIGLILLMAFITIFGLAGCEKIVEVQVPGPTDTLRIPVVAKGYAGIRFVSMLNDPGYSIIQLRHGVGVNSPILAQAYEQSSNLFVAVQDSTAMQLYAHFIINGKAVVDSFTIPALDPGQLVTCALFQINDPVEGSVRLKPVYGNDSLRLKKAPEGKAYLRLINGVVDYPTPQNLVNVTLNTQDATPIFIDRESGDPMPVGFGEFHNYVEVPAGANRVFVKTPGDPSPVYPTQQWLFDEGGYYTARAVGSGEFGHRFLIDTEAR